MTHLTTYLPHNIKLFKEEVKKCNQEFIDIYFSQVCGLGFLELAKWMLLEFDNIDINNNNEYPFRIACEEGRYKILLWLWNIPNSSYKISVHDGIAFGKACKNDHIYIAKWLIHRGFRNITTKNNYAFTSACKNGHLKIIKWLLKIKPSIDLS